uniref:Organic cation/carnitine transporter 4 n=1 Tax=Cajanus cajan TaxID=3821 RepID=A0A151RNG7_CAJCA|nr:hypothetical protein KK1_034409 [Cajanus cajan]
MCMDEMLREYCGEFGRWQLKHFVLTNLACVLEAFHVMVTIFADQEPHWRCLAGSAGSSCNAPFQNFCQLKPGSWEWVGSRGSSTVSQWGLVCGDKFKVGLVRALFFLGSMIGGGVFGHVADSFLGRKRSLGVACALNAIFGCLTAPIEAMKLMSTIASSNGNHLPDGVLLVLDQEQSSKCEGLENKGAHSASIVDVIRNPITRVRLLKAMTLNFLCDLVYNGLSLNVTNLKNNLYLTVLINAVGEMPAFLITAVLLERLGRKPLGRKPLTVATMWFSGLFCLMGSMMGNVGVWKLMKMVCSVLGLFGMAGTSNLLYVYTSELFPTVVRNVALGCTTQTAEIGAMLAPFIVVLGGWLPFAVFALCGMVGGVFAVFLPETLNQPLYDTFDGLEAGLA